MIADFTTLAIQAGGWMELDRLYLQNRLLSMIGEQELGEVDIRPVATPAADLAEQLCQIASANQLVKTEQQKEQFMVQLMDLLTPPPSVVNAFFAQHYAKEPQEATEYFYQLCQKNGTVIEQEKPVVFSTVYGDFLANKVHSEAPKATLSAQNYPRCEWCMATEGYQGSQQFPATTNHRVIRMNLDGESWGFSFVKQAQYQQQGVIAFEKHQAAKRSVKTFQQLLKIVEVFPHYFAGIDAVFEQNEHVYYQTGLQQFPLAEASISEYVELANYPLINAGMVNWPVATFRLEGPNASEVAQAANDIFEQWQTLKLPTDEIQIVARRKELLYVMDLIFSRPQAKPSLTLAEVQGLTTWSNQKTQALETVASAYQQRLKEASAFAETSEGKAAFLMKGYLDTAVLLKAVVDKEKGLGKGGVMSHFSMFDVPSYHKILVPVDGGMVAYPTLEQKKAIIENTVETLRSMGYDCPKVGVLTCVEKVNSKMPETMEAAELARMNREGEIKNCIIEGPISYDCAIDAEIAKLKNYESQIAGDVDVLVAPNIHAGNIMGKMLTCTCKAKMAGFVVGAKCPIVLTSRGSSAEEKFLSIAVSAAAVD